MDRPIAVSLRRDHMRATDSLAGTTSPDTTIELRSDSLGVAGFCNIAGRAPVEASVVYRGRRFARTITPLDTSSLIEATITASPPDSSVVRLFGRVVAAASTSSPLPLAEVVVPALALSTRTRADGSFELGGLTKGVHTVLVRTLGYQPVFARVALPLRNDSGPVFALSPVAAELATVLVTGRAEARGVMGEFEERRATVVGATFLTRESLAKREHSALSDILRSVRGLRVQRLPDGSNVLASSRGAFSKKIPDCFYQVYIDGIRIYAPGSRGPDGTTKPPNLDDFASVGIEAIEVYPGPATTPARFSGLGAACGTIVIWSRRS